MIRAIRTDNNGCPYCHGTKIKREESFGALHPDLVAEWSPKNKFSPFEITENSKKDVEWVCVKGHTWAASVATRSQGYGYCRECFPFGKVIKSFADVHSDLRKYYSDKNSTPFDAHSQREYTHAIWTCDEEHEFDDTFFAIDTRGVRCPFCSGREIISGYNDFKTLYPEYARDYDEVKNALPANKISPKNSDMETFWRCKEGHSFQRSVRTHIVWRGFCPVCSRHVLVPGVNDLLTAYPRISDIWDYDRNGRGPEEIYNSNSKHHAFVCDKGHHYSATIQQVVDNDFSCLICDNIKFDAGINSLAVLKPELAKEWSPNNTRGADTVRPTDRMSALWKCPDCVGEYSTAIWDRDIGDESCPYCANRKILPKLNDLRTTHPDLVSEWSPNNDKVPERYWKKSSEYVKWICHVCHGEYSAIIKNREYNDYACPYCNRGELLTGFNDLATTDKQLASEWSPNNDRGPDTVCHSYWLTVKWICPDCGGEYSSPIKDREVGDDACPYCNRKSVLSGFNDLATVDPALAAEWSPNNERTPDSVRRDARLTVRWICPDCGGEYSAKIADREVGDEACPYCNRGDLLAGLNDLVTTDPELAKEWSLNNDKPASSVRRNYVYRALWVCADCGSDYRASVCDREIGDKLCPYCYGSWVKAGYNDLATTHPDLASEWSPSNEVDISMIKKETWCNALWICPDCGGEYRAFVKEREVGGKSCPYCYGRSALKGVSDLATVKPELVKEWSPNNSRTPDAVRWDIKTYYLWICPTCNQEYSARVCEREIGDEACPYCADKSTLSGYNDLATVDPALAVEWSPSNDRATDEVRRNQKLVGLWICPTCHGEYSARIVDCEIGDEACPYCADKKALPGFNSFMVRQKDLMAEWSEVENFLIEIDPDSVLDNDRRLVWWQCKDCGKKYMLSIYDRLLKQKRGHSSCPFCNGRRTKLVHYI
jgi:rubrerythrin